MTMSLRERNKVKYTKKNEIKKLYHITLGLVDELIPRVPKNVLKEEDSITPRVCVCPTIEDCFRSVSWGINYYEKAKYEGKDRELIRVLEFDVDNIGLDNIIDNHEIVKKSLVPDAFETNEFWIVNKSIKADKIFYIYPTSMDYTYLADHEYIAMDVYSYFKIEEGVISDEVAKKYNGTLYPWKLGIPEDKVTHVKVKNMFSMV